jgi:hypothetical protein
MLLLLTTSAAGGCDREPSDEPPAEPPRLPPPARRTHDAGLAELLGLDAAVLPVEPPPDPPAPAGNLRHEVEEFTTLERCVKSRAAFDPVVGDAVEALGYDTFKRDACQVLHAAKTRSTAPCRDILASMLRDHCETTVAVVIGDAMMCPLAGGNHNAMCMALARRDERLCEQVRDGLGLTCRAIIERDASKCRRSARCERLVQRWKAFMPEHADKPGLGTRVKVRVQERVDGGAATVRELDLSGELGGATVRKTGQETVVLLGDETTRAWPPALVATQPRLALRLTATEELRKQGRRLVPNGSIDFSILVPKWTAVDTGTLQGPAHIDVDLFGLDLTSPVRFKLQAVVGPPHRPVRVELDVNTFVRDVVIVGGGARRTPPD